MKRRIDMDWSDHVLKIEEHGEFATVHRLKKPNTGWEMVEFINIKGHGLLVCGDFGDWKFSRCFYPSKDGCVSEQYWIEKLHIANPRQDVFSFSQEALDVDIYQLTEYAKEVGRHDETKEYIDILKESVCRADVVSSWYHCPDWMEPEDYPEGVKTCKRLEIIFDAFDEVCRRMKPCERQEECKSKKVGKIGVCIFYREKNTTCQHPEYERILDWGEVDY